MNTIKPYSVLSLIGILVFFLLLSTGALSDEGTSYKPDSEIASSSSSSEGSDEQKVTTGTSYRPDSKTNKKSDNSTQNPANTPANRSGVENSKTYRPDINIGTNRNTSGIYKPPTSTTSQGSIYRPRENYYYGTSYRPDQKTLYYRERYYDNTGGVGYKPIYKSGKYYYPQHNYNRSFNFGYWLFDNWANQGRRSVYYYYGDYPYIDTTRIFLSSYPSVIYAGDRVMNCDGLYLADPICRSLDKALEDIRKSWLNGRYDLFEKYVRPSDRISIFLDGNFDYQIRGRDFLDMTRDVIGQTDTISFVWDGIRKRSNNNITAFAEHKFRDTNRRTQRVYLAYTFRPLGNQMYIQEVSSSNRKFY
ncbi:MAG: hypothetical protein SNJ70_08845 [Armatimonadota bacterium]